MHRLLQGDVGSGKTVVAALAAAVAIDAGWQCALMAPTEILAEQHFRKLIGWLEPLGIARSRGSPAAVKGQGTAERCWTQAADGRRAAHRRHARRHRGQGEVFARLGLAIVDEQHRFGVAQRLALRRKLKDQRLDPHQLMMSRDADPRARWR